MSWVWFKLLTAEQINIEVARTSVMTSNNYQICNCLCSCLVLGRLSIVYSCLLGSRFNLSSFRVQLIVVLSKGFESKVVQ